MNNIIFKNWAFRFTIWIILINVIVFYLTITYVNYPGEGNNTDSTLLYLGLLSSILLLLTLVFIIISSVKREKKNYQYWIPIIGIFILGILPLIGSFI